MASPSGASQVKVPEATLVFWVAKVLATTLGETGGDAVSMSLGLGYLLSTALFAVVFVVAVAGQVRARSYRTGAYWFAIVASTTVGTTLADFADRSLGLGYPGGAGLLLAALLGVLALWRRLAGTVSVASVDNPRSEALYWATIAVSQTLGTALGDWASDSVGLGYLGGIALFGGLLALVAAVGHWRRAGNRTWVFWSAFVLTRPLGAVVGDFLDKPVAAGGLALGRASASGVLLAALAVFLFAFPQRPARRGH